MQNLCEKAYETSMNIIQRILQSKCLSFFIGWTWLLSYGYLTRKNRIGCKSRSCHVSLIMLDIVAHDLKSINLYILAFLMTNGEIGLNSFRNLCHLLCQIPLFFWAWMLHVLFAKHVLSHIFNKNKSPCFSPISWDA